MQTVKDVAVLGEGAHSRHQEGSTDEQRTGGYRA